MKTINTAADMLKVVRQLSAYRRQNKLREIYFTDDYVYPWQKNFHKLGLEYTERMLLAANRVGKTQTCGAEVAIHATGLYPDWWEGHRYKHGINALAAAPTNELIRDILQAEMYGGVDAEGGVGNATRGLLGEGWVPKDAIGTVTWRNCGVANVVDTVQVKHYPSQTYSYIFHKSYEQGYIKYQGTSFDVAWFDEEPEDMTIFTEVITRLLTSKTGGKFIFSRTPLFGMTELVSHFVDNTEMDTFGAMGSGKGRLGITYINATWDDAPHLNKKEKERLMATYPVHERECRAMGVPMMGEGAVYPIADSDIMIEPFPIPEYFRVIGGMDFGIDHPFAAAWIAMDEDRDIIYVIDEYSQRGEGTAYHVDRLKRRGDYIPYAWPHDGMQKEKSSGRPLMASFRDRDIMMLPMSARYDNKIGGGQPLAPVLLEISDRMRSGRFKVFSTLTEWMKEKRNYHRKNGKVVQKHDDLMSATNYAVMMRRFACTQSDTVSQYSGSNSYDSEYNPFE